MGCPHFYCQPLSLQSFGHTCPGAIGLEPDLWVGLRSSGSVSLVVEGLGRGPCLSSTRSSGEGLRAGRDWYPSDKGLAFFILSLGKDQDQMGRNLGNPSCIQAQVSSWLTPVVRGMGEQPRSVRERRGSYCFASPGRSKWGPPWSPQWGVPDSSGGCRALPFKLSWLVSDEVGGRLFFRPPPFHSPYLVVIFQVQPS